MLIIKRVNGEVKYAFDPKANNKNNKDDFLPVLVPKLACRSSKHSLQQWYNRNFGMIDRITDMYIEAYTQYAVTNQKYNLVFDEEVFRQGLVSKLYKASYNTSK